ncbi:PilZ domain-containing protein [sulfur-oxidizing endosymbiont of Gigantopelta aegis]|uniref:PilZ domain-containing protein n=1 Tax=sulfur-oxidizing endosymbiont of Gigantopelta aegis TaxID=2794934 RepID=UPI0018DB7A37|nr:PilZ domain-containing protein [sulfur-oxidizing endosymbiont of Gigantopelta aegis]
MAIAAEVDRREHPRHPVQLEVFVSPVKVTNTRLASRIINMSLLGCAIEPNDYVFTNKEKLAICFVASKEQCSMSTLIKAEVAHICDDYIGLSFESMGIEVIELLRSLLDEAKYF